MSARPVVSEWATGDEANAFIECPRRVKCLRRSGLQAYSAVAERASHAKQVGQDGPADPPAPRSLGSMHRLDLRMVRVESLDSANAQDVTVGPETEQGDCRIAQPSHIERKAVLSRGLRQRELQMPIQQRPDVRHGRVLRGNLLVDKHGSNGMRLVFQDR